MLTLKKIGIFCVVLCLQAGSSFVEAATPVISTNGVVNNAGFAPGVNALAPGTIAAIFGTNLNDGTQNPFSSFGSNGRLLTTLGGASVTFNGFSAPMFSSFPGQLNVQIPMELAGSTTASVVVTVAGQQSAPLTVPIGPSSPGIFTINNNGQGAIQIANTTTFAAPAGSIPGAQSRPANPGDFITIFATGLGSVTNPPATGQASTGNPTVTLPQVTIGGIPATVSFSGMAPGFVGLYQVNIQVPTGAGGSIVQVLMSIGGKQSNVANIAVSGNFPSGGNSCSGFALQGTATSLTGTIPGICLFQGVLGSAVTGGVPVSLTGVTSASGTQTVYSGNVTGNGTAQCATGSTDNWTANLSLTITVGPTVTSLATNGGILSGNQNSRGSINFCGSVQNLNGIAASPLVTGSVNAGGDTTINIGGTMGLPPLVLRGNAQSVNGPLSGVTATALLSNNFSATGSVSISATGSTSGNQTVYTGIGSGTGIVQQCPGGSGTWTANVSSFTATVSPSVPSLATGGGTVSGNWNASLSGTVCGSNQSQTLSGTVSGTVSPGGVVTLTLTINTGGGGGGGGNNNPLVLTGTATSVSGTLSGTELFGPTATGSLPISLTGVSSSSQTVYSGSGTGSGTVKCPDGSTSNWTLTLTVTVTVSPAVTSLVTNGGSVSGNFSGTLSLTACGQSQSDSPTGTVSGTVSAGGAVTLTLTESGGN